MTQFYKLLGAITVGRSNLYQSIYATDCHPNHTSIKMNNNKEVIMEYGLSEEEYGEYSIESDGEEEEQPFNKRTSDAFELPTPDMDMSLIGPNVINDW